MLVRDRIERSSESVRACRWGFKSPEAGAGAGWKSVSFGLGGRVGRRGFSGCGVEKMVYAVPSEIEEGGGGGGTRARRGGGSVEMKTLETLSDWVVEFSFASLGGASSDWENSVRRALRRARLAVVKCFQSGGGEGKGAWGAAD